MIHLSLSQLKIKHMTTFETGIQNLQIALAIIVYLGGSLIILNSILNTKRKLFK